MERQQDYVLRTVEERGTHLERGGHRGAVSLYKVVLGEVEHEV